MLAKKKQEVRWNSCEKKQDVRWNCRKKKQAKGRDLVWGKQQGKAGMECYDKK